MKTLPLVIIAFTLFCLCPLLMGTNAADEGDSLKPFTFPASTDMFFVASYAEDMGVLRLMPSGEYRLLDISDLGSFSRADFGIWRQSGEGVIVFESLSGNNFKEIVSGRLRIVPHSHTQFDNLPEVYQRIFGNLGRQNKNFFPVKEMEAIKGMIVMDQETPVTRDELQAFQNVLRSYIASNNQNVIRLRAADCQSFIVLYAIDKCTLRLTTDEPTSYNCAEVKSSGFGADQFRFYSFNREAVEKIVWNRFSMILGELASDLSLREGIMRIQDPHGNIPWIFEPKKK